MGVGKIWCCWSPLLKMAQHLHLANEYFPEYFNSLKYCCVLNVNASLRGISRSNAFEHVIPSWWHCLGRLWSLYVVEHCWRAKLWQVVKSDNQGPLHAHSFHFLSGDEIWSASFLPLKSCLPWLLPCLLHTFVMESIFLQLEAKINSFSPKLLLSVYFITAAEEELRQIPNTT